MWRWQRRKKGGNDRCEIEEERPESGHKRPSRGEIGRLLLGVFGKLKVNFFREIVPLHSFLCERDWVQVHKVEALYSGEVWDRDIREYDQKDIEAAPIQPDADGVESYHRACDEFFLVPYIERCRDVRTFMIKARKWQDAWNWYRRHGGIGMRGLTPVQKLKETRTLIHKHIASFPVLLMEVWMMIYKDVMKFTNTFSSTGQYVRTKCLSRHPNDKNPSLYKHISKEFLSFRVYSG